MRFFEGIITQQLTSFIGRAHELTEITALLADPACRLLTLVGPGGIGKTRLALEAVNPSLNPSATGTSAGRPFHGEGLKDGVHFVLLQSVSDAALLPIAIANALGIQFFGSDEPRVQLLNYLRERQTLLILDNFEHLLDGVDFVVELLSAPGVKLLVTSRTALNIQAEWRYAVEGLKIPDRETLGGSETRPYHDTIENFDAVKLFAERARRLRHDFSLSDCGSDVIRICQLTEGMPLALELAAGWIRVMSCAEIANEIQRGLDFLAADVRDIPERHRSIAAAFSQSWHLLTKDEQSVFRKMSVFRGGFTRDAAAKVAGANLQILAMLVDKSFLKIDSTGRYDIHELLRQYGESKLEAAGETEAIRDAHSGYYVEFLAQRSKTIHGHQMIEILDQIEADFDDIRAAWYHAVAKRDDEGIGNAVEALTWYCDRRNHFFEHEELYAHTQEQFAPLSDEKPLLVWAQLMVRRAMLNMSHDESDEKLVLAKSLIEKSLAVVRLYDNAFESAYTVFRWGSFLAMMHHPDALTQFEQALSAFQALGDEFYISECWLWIGRHYANFNQMEQCIAYRQQAADLKLHIGDKNGAAWALSRLSIHSYDLGHFAACEHYGSEMLHLFHEVSNQDGIAHSMLSAAAHTLYKGALEEAYRLAQEAALVGISTPKTDFSAELLLAHINCILNEDYEQSLKDAKNLFKNHSRQLNYPQFMALCGLERYNEARSELSAYLGKMEDSLHLFGTVYVLTIAAIIDANQGEEGRAVQLLSLLFAQPIELVGWLKRWGLITRLLERLQANLGDQGFADAWEHGKTLNLDASITDIMAEFGVDENSSQPDPNRMIANPLTPRELDVLRLVAQGHSNRQIADELVIANTTVRGYVHIICQKFGAQNRTHAVIIARQLNLI